MNSWHPRAVPSDLEMVAHASAVITGSWPLELAAGTLLFLLGWALCRRSYQRKLVTLEPPVGMETADERRCTPVGIHE